MTQRTAAASYLASLIREMAQLAKRFRLKDLAMILDMAELQAGLDVTCVPAGTPEGPTSNAPAGCLVRREGNARSKI